MPQERHDAAPRLALGRGREQGDIRPEEHRADSGREAAHTDRQERHRTERGRLRKGAEKGPVGVRQERGARQCGEAMGERAERRQGDRGPREESVRERGGGENETERQQAGAAVAPAAERQMRGARREEYEQREQEPAGGRSGPRSREYEEHRGDGGHHLERSHPRYGADEQPSSEIYRCQNFANPFGGDAYVSGFASKMTVDSHHLLLFFREDATNDPIEACSGM